MRNSLRFQSVKSWRNIVRFLALMLCSSYASAKIVTAVIGDFPPYTSEFSVQERFAEDVVVAAFEASKYRVLIRRAPWKRALKETERGKADISFPWLKTDDNSASFFFSKPFIQAKEVFAYRRNEAFKWRQISDLKQYKIGTTLGYSNDSLLKEYGIETETAQTDWKNFQKLFKKRIDAFPIDEMVARHILSTKSKSYREGIALDTYPLVNHSYYLISGKVNKKRSLEIIEAFNEGLNIIRENGELDNIIMNYRRPSNTLTD